MPNEEQKTRRTRSTSLSAQVSHDDGLGTDDVFYSKRVKISSVVIFWMTKLLRFVWQRSITLLESVLRLLKKFKRHCHGNIKWFMQNHPPMVLFTLAISFFAVLLMSLAFYVSAATLTKVDVSQDWNMFLQRFSDLEFCVIHDNSTTSVPSATAKDVREKLGEHSVVGKDLKSFSVAVRLTIYPTKDFVSIPHNIMHLSTSIGGKYIGLKDDENKQRLNITMIVPYHWNASSCSNIPLHGCQVVELDVCLRLTGPQDLFPVSHRRPKSCPIPGSSGVDFWGKMNWQLGEVDSLYYCRSRTMINIQHKYDPSLLQPLKKPHRGVIRLHLLHTSFFLCIYVAIVFVYAVIFNHAKQSRISQSENPAYDC